MKTSTFCIALALLAASSVAVTELSILASITFNDDGSAQVRERYNLLLSDEREVESFENYRVYGQNNIVEWRRFSPNIRYHVSRKGTPAQPKITARRLPNIGSRSALIELEYYLAGEVAVPSKASSRVTRFNFNSSLLSLDYTAANELILPSPISIRLTPPPLGTIVRASLSPEPSAIDGNSVEWSGPITGKFSFAYLVEQQLGDEVSEYFNGLYGQGVSLIPSAVAVALVLLLASFLANKLLREKA